MNIVHILTEVSNKAQHVNMAGSGWELKLTAVSVGLEFQPAVG